MTSPTGRVSLAIRRVPFNVAARRARRWPAFETGRSIGSARSGSSGRSGQRRHAQNHRNRGGIRMTYHVSRRSLLALTAGLGATPLLKRGALPHEPTLNPQSPYFHRFDLGGAEVTVVSDGPL